MQVTVIVIRISLNSKALEVSWSNLHVNLFKGVFMIYPSFPVDAVRPRLIPAVLPLVPNHKDDNID